MKLLTTYNVDDHIAKYAFAIYQHRCEHGIEGDHLSDWYAGKNAYEEACEVGRLGLIELIEEYVRQEDQRLLNEILAMRQARAPKETYCAVCGVPRSKYETEGHDQECLFYEFSSEAKRRVDNTK